MKSKRVYTDYLRNMIEYAGKAVQFIQGVTFNLDPASNSRFFFRSPACSFFPSPFSGLSRFLVKKDPWRKSAPFRARHFGRYPSRYSPAFACRIQDYYSQVLVTFRL